MIYTHSKFIVHCLNVNELEERRVVNVLAISAYLKSCKEWLFDETGCETSVEV
jgi:hypothetical protein